MTEKYEARKAVAKITDEVMENLNIFQLVADSLPKSPGSGVYWADFWYDGGDDILCRTEALADAMADWLDEHGYCSVTGYFDPADDEREGCVDQLTGWYYVTI